MPYNWILCVMWLSVLNVPTLRIMRIYAQNCQRRLRHCEDGVRGWHTPGSAYARRCLCFSLYMAHMLALCSYNGHGLHGPFTNMLGNLIVARTSVYLCVFNTQMELFVACLFECRLSDLDRLSWGLMNLGSIQFWCMKLPLCNTSILTIFHVVVFRSLILEL